AALPDLASFPTRRSSDLFKDLIVVLEEGTRTALGVIAACGAAGIIVGVVTLTGLGLKVAGGIIELAGGILILTMFFTMIACIIRSEEHTSELQSRENLVC